MAVPPAVVRSAAAATARGWDPIHRFWQWLDDFARTPGAAGTAALTAAVVAYLTATSRIRHDRQVEREREAAGRAAVERAQRWEVLMWVYNGIATVDPKHLLRVCEDLAGEVETSLERSMLAAVDQHRLDAAVPVPDDRKRKRRRRAS